MTDIENVIIIGSGPAAYSAAIHVSKYRPLLFEGGFIGEIGPGGQLTTTTDVDNYPGFPKGIQGPDLMDNMRNQAIEMGVRIISKTVVKVTKKDDIFIIEDSKKSYETKSIIVATGASAKRLYVKGTHDNELWQKGISACAVCDGFIFKNKRVAVIGGGDSAMEEALYLANIAKKVYLIHRRDEFRAREDKLEKVRKTKNIEVLTPYNLKSANGSEFLESITLTCSDDDSELNIELEGLFFGIGHNPNVQFLNGLLELENGYVKTNRFMETCVNGIFACGDVQDYTFRQAVTAAASGSIAGIRCSEYLKEIAE